MDRRSFLRNVGFAAVALIAAPKLLAELTPIEVETPVLEVVAPTTGLFVSEKLLEDSCIPILQLVYADLVYGAAKGIEDAVLNGAPTRDKSVQPLWYTENGIL